MDTVITNIGQLVTPSDATLNASSKRSPLLVTLSTELHIHRGRIIEESTTQTAEPCRHLDAQGGVVLPGLIDPFWVAPRVPDGEDGASRPLEATEQWIRRLLHHAARNGLTTVELKCPQQMEVGASALLARLIRRSAPRVIGSLLVALSGDSNARHECVSHLIGEMIPDARQRRSASFLDLAWDKHADFESEARSILRAASGAGIRPKLHVIGETPTQALLSLATSLNVAAFASDANTGHPILGALSDAGVVPVFLSLPDPPAMRCPQPSETGVPAEPPSALGSGNGLRPAPLRSMWDVMASALVNQGMHLDEVITACTLGNASALERGHDLGSLEAGKYADLIILDIAYYRELPSVLGFPPIVSVLIEGEPVGDA